jgi:uncharacterized membrane protein
VSVTDILRLIYQYFEHPWVILLIIPAIPLLVWMLRRTFIEVRDDAESRASKKKTRKIMMFTRIMIIFLLLVALSSPFIETEKIIEGDPFIQVLIDNSTSMSVFQDVSEPLVAGLKNRMNTESKVVGQETISNIGDSVLQNLESHGSILLVSDGNVNSGADLGDVALYASKVNATINAIKLNAVKDDVSVAMIGPAKVLEGSDASFSVLLNRVGNIQSVPLVVQIDGETIHNQLTSDPVVSFTRRLSPGVHKITARIESNDYFPNNNAFYMTIKVVPRPRILMLSEGGSPLKTLLDQLFVVDVAASLPASMANYYAVVVNDRTAQEMKSETDVLNDFVADGNGMVVFGGEHSYDKGGYRNSLFETMLPVVVGAPEKDKGDLVIAIVIDISGSAGAPFGRWASTADFEKAAAIGIMNGVKLDTRVAVLAFNHQAYLISEPTPVFQKQGVDDLISRIQFGGGTQIAAGILKAVSVIGDYSGSKNIVLLSDGKTQGTAAAYEAARYAANAGIKIYTVGVGPTTDEQTMIDIADLTNGVYFRADEESKLNILFGDTDEQEAQSGQMQLVIWNKNHFITAGLEPNSTLYGYNQVSPKGAGRLLAVTSTGEPILTVWRLGLGRVAAVSTDDGSKWAGSLLGSQGSKLIARTMNWAIGDPERKSASFIEVKDTRLGEPAEITVKSEVPPVAEGVTFFKIDEDIYTGSLIPTSVGFQEVAGTSFAVNYEREYEEIGINPELARIVASTGGRMFDPTEYAQIADFAKTKAKRVINSREYLRWPFIVIAIIIYLVEIFIRRVVRKE